MGLGNRDARRHETVGFQKNAVNSEDYADFRVDQTVMTIDGFPGVVAAVYDGPHPGNESYQVTLHDGLGGGEYTASQLRPLEGTTASFEGVASLDYPELSDILVRRPDIAREG